MKSEGYPNCPSSSSLTDKSWESNKQKPSEIFGNASNIWLEKAEQLAEDLLEYKVITDHGFGWGYPFDWQNVNGLMVSGTPHVAATPYCYEAFARLFELTRKDNYLQVANLIAEFLFADLNDTRTSEDATAGSYTPFDFSKVINASAYRAFVLFDAAHRFESQAYADKAMLNLRFILQSQNCDGSWLYAIDNPKEAFIDHFHTCFVLKNLYKLNHLLNDSAVGKAIKNGFEYYHQEMFDHLGLPKSFVIEPRRQINRLEMYDVAEAINLGVLIRSMSPEAFNMAKHLAWLLIRNFQLKSGHFVTRLYIGGHRHKLPFLRWPQAQLFHALTTLFCAIEAGRKN
jgi:hypothetical protein